MTWRRETVEARVLGDLDQRLLKIVENQADKHSAHYDGMRWDCASACAPPWRSRLYAMSKSPLKQPAEVWEPFLRMIAARPVISLREQIELAARRCESPIEELLFLALVAVGSCYSEDPVVIDGREPLAFCGRTPLVCVSPQQTIGKYRVDFTVAVFTADVEVVRLDDGHDEYIETWHKGSVVVEVDGHDFHERTKEQASHDKKKDRDLQKAGCRIFRYTGSDIWNSPMDYAAEILDAAHSIASESSPIEIVRTRSDDIKPSGGGGA